MSKAASSASRRSAMDFAKAAWPAASRARKPGSVIFRQIEVGERVAGVSARKPAQGLASTQRAMTAALASVRRDQRRQAADGLGPAQRVDGVFHHQKRGRVDGLAAEDALVQLPLAGELEDLRQGPGGLMGFQPRHRPRAQHDQAVGAFAPQHLLPGPGDDIELRPGQIHGEDRGGRIADDQTVMGLRNPFPVGHAHARGGAVPGEDHVAV